MSQDFEAHSNKNLDKYGVWIKKKAPEAPKDNFDYFSVPDSAHEQNEYSNADIQTDILSSESDADYSDLAVDFDEEPIIDTEEEKKEIEVSNFDDTVGFASAHSESEDTSTDTADNSEVASKNNEENLMGIHSDDMEEINLDDFLSDTEPVNAPAKQEAPQVSETKTETASQTVELSESEARKVNSTAADSSIDLDIEFADSPEKENTATSSSFDAMLDAFTNSDNDGMTEISLDDFMDDMESKKKIDDDEEEVQEIVEPKTTVEEFSLDSITASKTSTNSTTPKTPTEAKNKTIDVDMSTFDSEISDKSHVQDAPLGISTESFEEISLDDFLSSDTDPISSSEKAEPVSNKTEQQKKTTSGHVDLSIGEATDSVEMQDINGSAYNEVDNVDLLGNELGVVPESPTTHDTESPALEIAEAETSDDMQKKSAEASDFVDHVDFVHDLPDMETEFEQTPNKAESDARDIGNDTVHTDDIEISLDTFETSSPEHATGKSSLAHADISDTTSAADTDSGNVADLTAIVEDEAFEPAAPDFALAEQQTEKPERSSESNHETSIEDKQIVENHNFDDVGALTDDLLSDAASENTAITAPQQNERIENDKTGELLMKLVDEISSMRSEISSLKDEIVSVKEGQILQQKDTTMHVVPDDGGPEVPSAHSVSEETSEALSDIVIPEIDTFDENTAAPHSDTANTKTEIHENLAQNNEPQGFFTDDNTDETISLTGDELDNILQTANFTDEAPIDEAKSAVSNSDTSSEDFEVPQILDLSETFEDTPEAKTVDEKTDNAVDMNDESGAAPSSFNDITDIPETLETVNKDDTNTSNDIFDDFNLDFDDDNTKGADMGDFDTLEIEPEAITDSDTADFSDAPDAQPDMQIAEPEHETFVDMDSSVDEEVPAVATEETVAPEISEAEPSLGDIIADEDDSPAVPESVSNDENEHFNTDVLDNIVKDIPAVDLGVDGLDEHTASNVEEKLSTVQDELCRSNKSETLPIDMKEEIKSVLTYMDQLLESLPEEKIEEFARSEYFETYKKLFEDLGIS